MKEKLGGNQFQWTCFPGGMCIYLERRQERVFRLVEINVYCLEIYLHLKEKLKLKTFQHTFKLTIRNLTKVFSL